MLKALPTRILGSDASGNLGLNPGGGDCPDLRLAAFNMAYTLETSGGSCRLIGLIRAEGAAAWRDRVERWVEVP